MRGIGLQPDARERLWLSAFSGFTLGLAIGLMVYEVRARGVSIALRRLTDLAASVDGRLPEETPARQDQSGTRAAVGRSAVSARAA